MIETEVEDLKLVIADHNGENVADRSFSRRVENLISAFHDNIGEVAVVPARTLFDLYVIKILYVERQSRDASIVDYLGQMLYQHLLTPNLFVKTPDGSFRLFYLSDALHEAALLPDVQDRFEAYREYGDRSLLLTGVFPAALKRRRRNRRGRSVEVVDRTYYVTVGKRFYRLAARHELAEDSQRAILSKLSTYFEVYLEALNEVSKRYLLGFDAELITDKMLDSFNRYRASGNQKDLREASEYASFLNVNPDALSGLRSRGRGSSD